MSAPRTEREDARWGIVFDWPEGGDPMFAGWTRDGQLGFAPTLRSAAMFESEEIAQRHLDNNYGPAVHEFGVVVEVEGP